jgi:hypothetical protein
MAASVLQIAQRRSETEWTRGLRASKSRLCRGEEEGAEAFLPPRATTN